MKEFQTIYYTESHDMFRQKVRSFVEVEMMPFISEWEERKIFPAEVRRKAFEQGILPVYVGVPNVFVHNLDSFHELIALEELAAVSGSVGVLWGFQEGLAIGLPPVL